jgi:1-phosphatidylinositol-4-phosphate 5-kinase
VRFVVMANIFVTDLQIHRRYDIKGSTDGRTVGPEGRAK